MKLDPKHRQLVVTVVAGVMTLGYVVFVFLPAQREINSTNQQAQQQETFLQSTTDVDLRLAEATQELTTAREFNASWRQQAPKVGQLGGILSKVIDHASTAAVKVVNFDPQTSLDGLAVRRVPVMIECEGSVAQVFEFVRLLETMPQTCWVDEFRVSRSKDRQDLVQAELSLAIFADNHENSG